MTELARAPQKLTLRETRTTYGYVRNGHHDREPLVTDCHWGLTRPRSIPVRRQHPLSRTKHWLSTHWTLGMGHSGLATVTGKGVAQSERDPVGGEAVAQTGEAGLAGAGRGGAPGGGRLRKKQGWKCALPAVQERGRVPRASDTRPTRSGLLPEAAWSPRPGWCKGVRGPGCV